MNIILDAKYQKVDLNKVMPKQCQHLSLEERKRLISLLRSFEDMFDGRLAMWDTKPVDLELKDGANPVCLRL